LPNNSKAQLTANETDLKTDEYSTKNRFFRYYRRSDIEQTLEKQGFSSWEISLAGEQRQGVQWIEILARK
jgi:hypothetical protein